MSGYCSIIMSMPSFGLTIHYYYKRVIPVCNMSIWLKCWNQHVFTSGWSLCCQFTCVDVLFIKLWQYVHKDIVFMHSIDSVLYRYSTHHALTTQRAVDPLQHDVSRTTARAHNRNGVVITAIISFWNTFLIIIVEFP